jgi:hypothetical protein
MPSYMQLMASSSFADEDPVFEERLDVQQGTSHGGVRQGESKLEPEIKIDVRGNSLPCAYRTFSLFLFLPFYTISSLCLFLILTCPFLLRVIILFSPLESRGTAVPFCVTRFSLPGSHGADPQKWTEPGGFPTFSSNFIAYLVVTQTSLASYPQKTMSVRRRFRDFVVGSFNVN